MVMSESTEEMNDAIDEMRARMSTDDLAQWDAIQEWKAAQIRPIRPRVISQRIRSYLLAPLAKAVSLARKVPGGAAVTGAVASGILRLVELGTSAAESSINRERIVRAFRRAGCDIECLEDIRHLSLAQICSVKPHLKVGYCGVAATEGAISSIVASGGSVAALAGLGVASAPGVGVVAGAIGLDIMTFLASATRLVSHTAAYYGYDTADPAEDLFAAMVLSQAISPESEGRAFVVEKETSMLLLNKVMRKLARRGSMETIGNNALTASVNSLFAALGARLVGLKMAQIVPIVGIIVGVSLNVSLIRTIGVTADHLYRERLLMERYTQGEDEESPAAGAVGESNEDDLDAQITRYVELAEAEGRR